ncbi:MAG: hypothetical protein JXR94_01555 [Candidatus Hydrogenedentes bacterium]|nr:hypothetical protein [Candidatus Hydrogenedentota bacterium]
MKNRADLLPVDAPAALEVWQLTEDTVPCSHLYMEAQVFTPDSKRFVLHRSAHPHGSDQNDPEHRYLVCDLENGGALHPITEETGATAATVSPDGTTCYYFVNETSPGGGRLTLKRIGLDGSGRETLCVIDGPIPGSPHQPSRPYPLSTISSDGKRLAISAFLGDGNTENAPFGLLIFDLEGKEPVRIILEGPSWLNMHPQYSRSLDADGRRDILVQENHGGEFSPAGSIIHLTGGAGADIHAIRDDGTAFRNLPWGRDGNEFCQGHQCWRGRSASAITGTSVRDRGVHELIESEPVAFAGHVGLATPGGRRNTLSRTVEKPSLRHFATDIEGTRLITDDWASDGRQLLRTAEFGPDASDPLENWRFLLDTDNEPAKKGNHSHPFLSPDGNAGFFNSDESGQLQAYMVTGLFQA